jgi:hypothetical protein
MKLKEELSNLSLLKNKDLDDRSKWREASKYNLIGDLNDDSIVDANK